MKKNNPDNAESDKELNQSSLTHLLTMMKNPVNHQAIATEIAHIISFYKKNHNDNELLKLLIVHILDKISILPKSSENTFSWNDAFKEVFIQTGQMQTMQMLIELMESKTLTNLGLVIDVMTLFDESQIPELPIEKIIDYANEAQLEQLINLDIAFNDVQLQKMVDCIQSPGNIDKLLDKPYMTSQLAEILLQKPDFNGKLKHTWTWITKDQILLLIDKAKNYSVLQTCMTDLRLTQKDKEQWLNQLIAKHKDETRTHLGSQNPKIIFELQLAELKLLACAHTIKPVKNNDDLARIAFNLYCDLNKISHQFFNLPFQNKKKFRKNCTDLIEASEHVLYKNKAMKQILLNILNTLSSIFTLRYDKPNPPGTSSH